MSRTSALGTLVVPLLPPPSTSCGLGKESWAARGSGGIAGPQLPRDMGTGTEDTLLAQPPSSAASVVAEQPGHNYYLHQSQLCIVLAPCADLEAAAPCPARGCSRCLLHRDGLGTASCLGSPLALRHSRQMEMLPHSSGAVALCAPLPPQAVMK